MRNYDLRPATAQDFDFLWRLTAATMRPYVESIWGWDDTWQHSRFRTKYDPARWRIIVLDGTDIGGIAVDRLPLEIFLADIQILPDYQGMGIGSAVIRSVIEDAQRENLVVSLNVLKSNPRARKLYEAIGFRAIGQANRPEHDLMVILPQRRKEMHSEQDLGSDR